MSQGGVFRKPPTIYETDSGSATVNSDQELEILGGDNVTTSASGNTITITSTGGGAGTITGPGSSTDNALVRWNGTDGTAIQNSGSTLSDAGVLTLATPLGVESGGNGAGTFTAYSVLCAGTTATGDFQNVSGVGSSGQVLTSQGAGSIPQWTTIAGSGDVVKVGIPVDSQIGIWTGDGTIEGDSDLTYDTSTNTLGIVTSGKLSFGGVNILSDSTGTMTLSNVDALDATTEATIEAAIDTLANLTSASSLATIGTITSGVWTGTDIAVDAGGSGRSSATAYAVLCGGTTSTAAHQSIASVGTSGQVLTSNGAGALPTFQAATGGVSASGTPVDNQIAVWTDASTIEGDSSFLWDGTGLKIEEVAAAAADTAGFGQIWVKNATPNQLWFTDDAGTDTQLGVGGGMPDAVISWNAGALDVNYSPLAPLEQITTTNIVQKVRAFDYATIEYCDGFFEVPPDIDSSGTVTFSLYWMARTVPSPSENVIWQIEHAAVATTEDLDSATFTAEVAAASATGTTQNAVVRATWTETVTNLGWVAGDTVYVKWSRKSTDANDTFDSAATTADDALMTNAAIIIPQA